MLVFEPARTIPKRRAKLLWLPSKLATPSDEARIARPVGQIRTGPCFTLLSLRHPRWRPPLHVVFIVIPLFLFFASHVYQLELHLMGISAEMPITVSKYWGRTLSQLNQQALG